MRYVYQVYTDTFVDNIRTHTDYAIHTNYEEAKFHAESIIQERMHNKSFINQKLSETTELCMKDVVEHLKEMGECQRYSVAVSYGFTGRTFTERVNIVQWRIK